MDGLTRQRPRIVPALLLGLLAAGCGAGKGTTVAPGDGPRIVSLAPHLTELAFAAGAGDRVVGTVAYSDYPEAAKAIPRVGDAFSVDFERVIELDPDVVLIWEGGTPASVVERLETLGLTVNVVATERLSDVPDRLVELGDLAGDPAAARAQATAFRDRLDALRRAPMVDRVPVFFQISLQPLYTVGGPHFISELIELCGGQNVFADLDALAAPVAHEAVLSRGPRLILTGYHDHDAAARYWARVSAANNDVRVVAMDQDLVTRPTLRLAEGAARLCAAVESVRDETAAAPPSGGVVNSGAVAAPLPLDLVSMGLARQHARTHEQQV